jgi:4-hydroxybenzoate polyprenyltransferase
MANIDINQKNTPLCVDLDGTLIKTDSLHELFLRLVKKNPLYCFAVLFWLIKSKAFLKAKLVSLVQLPAEDLPYNQDVIEYIKSQSDNREVILVTGCNENQAKSIAEYLNLFDEVVASDTSTNMTSHNKRDYLVERFGQGGYEYIGNERADKPVWNGAGQVSIVSRENSFLKSVRNNYVVKEEFILPTPSVRDYLKAIRIHQWVKNILVFVPFFLNQRFNDFEALTQLSITFLCLSLLASITYIINDLLDLDADRVNQYKSKRAFASCLISIKQASLIITILLVCLVALASTLSMSVIVLLLIYLLTTLLYSFSLKAVAILDVIVLAGLFTIRILCGVVAIHADWSFWLLAFSMFFFLSLAFAKRFSELVNLESDGRTKARGRGYYVEDRIMLKIFGITSGFISILVVALYINSQKVSQMYSQPEFLWLICPILMYWIGRVWLITGRGQMHEDPIVFAISDRISIATVLLCGISVLAAVTASGFVG